MSTGTVLDPVLTSKTCILHLPSTSKARLMEQLKEFTDSTWFRAKEAETVRKNSLKNSKFFVITLPESFKLNMCYHSSCYSEFTAISKQCKPVIHRAITTDKSDQPTLRSSVVHPSTSSTGVFETKCLFCGQGRKWAKGKFESLGDLRFGASADKIYKSATILDDSEILAKISGLDLLAKQVKVHHSCRNEYIKRADRETLKAKDNVKTNAAYELLKKYVQQNLVDIKGAEKLTSLYDRYLSANKGNSQTYRADYVKEKLLTHFNTDLKICKASNKGGIIFYNAQMPKEEAIRRANFDCHLVKEAAYYLRSQIKQCSTTVEDLPSPLTGDILKKGQCAAPPELVDFFTILYGESRDLRKLDRIVQSSCDDVVFNVTNGKIKPGKHITLAMTMKSLTGSRKVVEILNRLGHSTNYHTVEEIETQMASEIADRKTTAPDGILQEEGLCSSLAWVNYDENTETLSGSGTLHDTVGICYQNEVKEQSEQNIPVSDNITELEQAIATVQITESSTKITTGSKRKKVIPKR